MCSFLLWEPLSWFMPSKQIFTQRFDHEVGGSHSHLQLPYSDMISTKTFPNPSKSSMRATINFYQILVTVPTLTLFHESQMVLQMASRMWNTEVLLSCSRNICGSFSLKKHDFFNRKMYKSEWLLESLSDRLRNDICVKSMRTITISFSISSRALGQPLHCQWAMPTERKRADI